MAEENYMDRFSNPEEFIRQQILAKGNFSSLDKKEMYRLIRVYIATQIINQTNKKQTILHNRKRKFF